MATYSNNTTIKVNAAVSASSAGAPATLYTAPANGYAILNALLSTSNGATEAYLNVGGVPVGWHKSSATLGVSSSVSGFTPSTFTDTDTLYGFAKGSSSIMGIYVGPGQSIAVGGSGCHAFVSGTEFVNTP